MRFLAALVLTTISCGGRVVFDTSDDDAVASSAASGTGGGGAASTTSPSSSGSSGSGGQGGTSPRQCLCENEPGYQPCVLPLMCCPCTEACEDPDTFLCSCSENHTCD